MSGGVQCSWPSGTMPLLWRLISYIISPELLVTAMHKDYPVHSACYNLSTNHVPRAADLEYSICKTFSNTAPTEF